jgi:hypothetical protein
MRAWAAVAILACAIASHASPHYGRRGTLTQAGGGLNPILAATNTGTNVSSNSTSGTVQLPSSISASDLLIVIAGHDGSPSGISIGTTSPNEYAETSVSNTTAVTITFATKTADGAEGSTAAAAWTNNEQAAFGSLRLTGWSAVASASATGTSAAPNPPAVSYTAPARIIAACALDGGTSAATFSTIPAGYSSVLQTGTASAGGVEIAVAELRLTSGTSENPGAFATTPGGDDWVCLSIAVED